MLSFRWAQRKVNIMSPVSVSPHALCHSRNRWCASLKASDDDVSALRCLGEPRYRIEETGTNVFLVSVNMSAYMYEQSSIPLGLLSDSLVCLCFNLFSGTGPSMCHQRALHLVRYSIVV